MKKELILEVKSLHKSYHNATGNLEVIRNLDFSAEKGEVICLLGPSGCGKSTLLRCISGFTDFSGQISLLGGSAEKAIAEKTLGFVFQEPSLIPWMNVTDNILLPSRIGKKAINGSDSGKKATALLDMIGLKDFSSYFPNSLSGGMRQRVAFARALLLEPKLLLLDEPFSSIDSLTKVSMMIELKKILSEKQITTLIITHNIEEAAFLADRIFILSSKPARIVQELAISYKQERNLDLLNDPEFYLIAASCRRKLFNHEK